MRNWRKQAALLLMVLAVWLLGESAYLFAKARFAQYLLDDAWQRSLRDV